MQPEMGGGGGGVFKLRKKREGKKIKNLYFFLKNLTSDVSTKH